MRQGGLLSKVCIIKSGIVKCYHSEEICKNYIHEFFGPGEIVGEIEAIKNTEIFANIEAVTAVTVYQLRKEHFMKLVSDNKKFSTILIESLANRIMNTGYRAAYQQIYPSDYSVLRLLMLFSEQSVHLSKQDMAEYLGVTLRNLNRALKKLVQGGIITFEKDKGFVVQGNVENELDKLKYRSVK